MRDRLALGAIAVTLFISALAMVYTTHRSRLLFVELQALNEERDGMSDVWGKLQLELGSWLTHERIAKGARDRLGMRVIRAQEVQIVRP